MIKIIRKKPFSESMIIPKKCYRFSCSLKLETDTILLMKLRSIFKVSSDKDLSDAICKYLNNYAREIEQKDLEIRRNNMEKVK